MTRTDLTPGQRRENNSSLYTTSKEQHSPLSKLKVKKKKKKKTTSKLGPGVARARGGKGARRHLVDVSGTF